MGQRLNIELFYNGERVANAYYHWSGFTSSAFDLTRQIIINYDEVMGKDLPIQIKAILLLQTTRAGLTKDEFEWAEENISQFDEYKDILVKAVGRNEGLIAVSEEGMNETQAWEDATLTTLWENQDIINQKDVAYCLESDFCWEEDYNNELNIKLEVLIKDKGIIIYKKIKNKTIINGFHIELGHTIEEYNALYGKDYENGDLWDFSIEDIENGAIEPNPNMIYWQIGDRVYETYK